MRGEFRTTRAFADQAGNTICMTKCPNCDFAYNNLKKHEYCLECGKPLIRESESIIKLRNEIETLKAIIKHRDNTIDILMRDVRKISVDISNKA